METQQSGGGTQNSRKKEWYKHWWGVIIAIIILPVFAIWYVWAKSKLNTTNKWVMTGLIIIFTIIISVSNDSSDKKKETTENQPKTNTPQVQETKAEVQLSPEEIAEKEAEEKVKQEAEDKAKNIPAEYKSALYQATSYANTMHMSKRGVYDQLVSEYGEKFTAVAAQYAIDNVKADWNANALAKAKIYQETMHQSPSAIHGQLTSQYGEKFTKAEADYAIQHLND